MWNRTIFGMDMGKLMAAFLSGLSQDKKEEAIAYLANLSAKADETAARLESIEQKVVTVLEKSEAVNETVEAIEPEVLAIADDTSTLLENVPSETETQ